MLKKFDVQTTPVTLIGGYLGAGKTTLVNHLLRHADGLRIAVLVNEFGELPIDGDLIKSQDEDIINIAGGCVCCAYGSDLMLALNTLQQLDSPPEHVLIEASGVALPDSIAKSIQLIQYYRIDSIAILADAETLMRNAHDTYLADTIRRQLESAYFLLLTKTDLVDRDTMFELKDWLAQHYPDKPVMELLHGAITIQVLLGQGLSTTPYTPGTRRPENFASQNSGHHPHHHAMTFDVLKLVEPELLLQELINSNPDLVRIKGFVRSADQRVFTVQAVGCRLMTAVAPPDVENVGKIICISAHNQVDSERITEVIDTHRTE